MLTNNEQKTIERLATVMQSIPNMRQEVLEGWQSAI